MHIRKMILVLIVALVPFAAAAQSPRVLAGLAGAYQGADDAGAIAEVNPSTGALTILGTPVPGTSLTGLAANSAGELFGVTGSNADGTQTSRLIQIDPNTGALIADIGDVTGPDGDVSIQDLAFQPGTGVLFGMVGFGSGGFSQNELVVINTATAAATSVSGGGIPSDGGYIAIAFGGDGTLYGKPTNSGQVMTISPANGSILTSTTLSPAVGAVGFGAIMNGVGFLSECCSDTSGNDIYTIDVANHTAAYLGAAGGSRRVHDFALVGESQTPVPANAPWSLLVLFVGIVAAAWWLLRRA